MEIRDYQIRRGRSFAVLRVFIFFFIEYEGYHLYIRTYTRHGYCRGTARDRGPRASAKGKRIYVSKEDTLRASRSGL